VGNTVSTYLNTTSLPEAFLASRSSVSNGRERRLSAVREQKPSLETAHADKLLANGVQKLYGQIDIVAHATEIQHGLVLRNYFAHL